MAFPEIFILGLMNKGKRSVSRDQRAYKGLLLWGDDVAHNGFYL